MPDPTLRLKYYQETGQTEQAKLYEQYLRETGQLPSSVTDEEPKPGIGTKILGTAASLVRDIPGMEAIQAGARSAVRTGLNKVLPESIAPDAETYREARENIRGGEDAAPKMATIPARLAGAGIAAAAIPGGLIRQGATYGALSGALKSDPDAGLMNRAVSSGVEGTVGGALGAAGALGMAIKRAPSGSAGKIMEAAMPNNLRRAGKVIGTIRRATAPAAEKAVPKAAKEIAAPQVEGLVTSPMDNVLEAVKAAERGGAEARGLPDVVKATQRYRTESGRLQQGAPRARFDHFAEQMAKRKSAGGGEVADLTDADRYAMTLEHIRQGGTLQSAADALKRVRGTP